MSKNGTKGVILAGGRGTRLDPLTRVANKHLLPVYDKPMILYPIKTLIDYGCEEIIIVTGGEHLGGFSELLGNGEAVGVQITYRVQNQADGVAGALKQVEGLVDGVFPVILGDNYFSEPLPQSNTPMIFVKETPEAHRFGVYHNGQIIEKPDKALSDLAVVGFYIYDDSVFEFLRHIQPSARGELEITDVNNWYLAGDARVRSYDGYWHDMGTFNSLLEVANRVAHVA